MAHIGMEDDVHEVREVHRRSEDEEEPEFPLIPTRKFDAYALLTIVKTVGDGFALWAMALNDFTSGIIVAVIGIVVSILLRFLGNNLMPKEARHSGIEAVPFGPQALLNTLLGTRFGYQGHYERLKSEIETGAVQARPALPENSDTILPPTPDLYGNSETGILGPRTLQSMAEVIQQGFVFYPTLILFLESGFDNSEIKGVELLTFSALVTFFHILCWLVSPSLNVCYGYVYYATWISFTLPFLLLSLFEIPLGDGFPDSYYTRKEIYAWTRTTITLVFGTLGLAVYTSAMRKMIIHNDFTDSAMPAILYFQQSISGSVMVFETISLIIILASDERFFFDDPEGNPEGVNRMTAVVLTNVTYAGWSLLAAHIETITVQNHLK